MILIENYFSILQIFLFHYSFIFDNRKKKNMITISSISHSIVKGIYITWLKLYNM